MKSLAHNRHSQDPPAEPLASFLPSFLPIFLTCRLSLDYPALVLSEQEPLYKWWSQVRLQLFSIIIVEPMTRVTPLLASSMSSWAWIGTQGCGNWEEHPESREDGEGPLLPVGTGHCQVQPLGSDLATFRRVKSHLTVDILPSLQCIWRAQWGLISYCRIAPIENIASEDRCLSAFPASVMEGKVLNLSVFWFLFL